MRKIIFAVGLSLLALPALADSYNFGQRVVTDGDAVGKLIEVAGQPSRIVPLENTYGAADGERWEYYLHGKTVSFVIKDGRIASITETR